DRRPKIRRPAPRVISTRPSLARASFINRRSTSRAFSSLLHFSGTLLIVLTSLFRPTGPCPAAHASTAPFTAAFAFLRPLGIVWSAFLFRLRPRVAFRVFLMTDALGI